MKQRVFITLVALACGLTQASADAKPEPSASSPTASNKADTSSDQPVRTTLDNGLRVVIVPDHLAPVATSVIAYGVGGRDTPADRSGLAHAAEHMMFQGSPGLSRDQNLALIATLGGAANAQTLTDYTQYYATVPAQYLGVLLHLQATRMAGADNRPKRWETERGAIKNEVAGDRSDPAFRAQTWMRSQLLAGTPLADTPLGTKKGFDATTAKDIAAFHDAWYAPNNAVLTVVGDVAARDVLQSIRGLFGDIPRHDLPDHPSGKLAPLKPAQREFVSDSGMGSISIGFRTPGQDDREGVAAMWLLIDILDDQTGPLTSRLVVTGDALSASASLTTYASAGTSTVSAMFRRGQDADKLAKQLENVLASVAQNGVSADQLAAAKRHEITVHASQLDSVPGLAMAWSSDLMSGSGSPEAKLARIQSVGLDQINALAQKVYGTDRHITAVLTPFGSGKAQSVARASGSQEDKIGGDHPPEVALPDWAADRLAKLHVPQQTVEPIATDLDNGLKLIVVPSPDVHAVHVLGAVASNAYLATPKGQFGVAGLVTRLMSFGTTQHDRLAFQKAANDIGALLNVGSQFSMTVMPDELDSGLALLAESERQPAFPKPLFHIFKQNYAAAVPGVLASADYQTRLTLLKGVLPPNDPKLRHETAQSVQSISYKDLNAYYHKTFRPDVTTLVVVGPVDPDRVIQGVKQHFGDWQAKGPRPTLFLGPVRPNIAGRHHVPDPSRHQATVADAEMLGIRRTDDDYDALVLGNQVLSGGMLDSRLYRELRIKRGLVYSVGAGLSSSPNRTSFSVHYASDPKNVDQADRIIHHELEDLRRHPVSKHALRQAKTGLLRNLALAEYSADAIGQALGDRAIKGLALDYPYQRAQSVPDINAQQVQAAFKKWIRPDDFVTVVRGPKLGGDSP